MNHPHQHNVSVSVEIHGQQQPPIPMISVGMALWFCAATLFFGTGVALAANDHTDTAFLGFMLLALAMMFIFIGTIIQAQANEGATQSAASRYMGVINDLAAQLAERDAQINYMAGMTGDGGQWQPREHYMGDATRVYDRQPPHRTARQVIPYSGASQAVIRTMKKWGL